MTSDTCDRLIQLAARRFRVDAAAISPDDDLFARLGIDSVQALALLTELEDTFHVEIPDYELQDARTFRALADVVDRRA